MIRGMTTFKCSECGKRFKAMDIEWNATVFSAPHQCPKCGSMHTRPWSISPAFIEDAKYRPIWKVLDAQSGKFCEFGPPVTTKN